MIEIKQVQEMINTIKSDYEQKIKALSGELATTLSVIEKTFGVKVEHPKDDSTHALPDSKPIKINRGPVFMPISVPKRMKAALNKMTGDFERMQLLEMTKNDETGIKSPIGTLSIAFANLVKSGGIIEVRKSRGTVKGLYRRANENKTQAISSPTVQEGVLL